MSAREIGFRWVHHQTRLLEECAEELGDRFVLPLGAYGDVLVLRHPDDIGAVFAASELSFAPAEGVGVFGMFAASSPLRREGLDHRASRRRLVLALAGARLATVRAAAEQAVAAALAPLKVGDNLDLGALAERVSAEVSARLLLGRPAEAMPTAVSAMLGAAAPFSAGGGQNNKLINLVSAARQALRLEVEAGPGPEPSVLSACSADGQPPIELEELLTVAAAAGETTAVSLCWLLADLLAPPSPTAPPALAPPPLEQLQRALQHEERPELLDATVRESLRLRPPIAAVLMRAPEALSLPGLALSADAVVAPSPWLAHRRPEAWPDPLRFLPERFLPAPPGRAAAPHTWIPFGGGSRRCPGEQVAMHSLSAALAALLRRVRPGLLPRRPLPARRFLAIAPAGRLQVSVQGFA